MDGGENGNWPSIDFGISAGVININGGNFIFSGIDVLSAHIVNFNTDVAIGKDRDSARLFRAGTVCSGYFSDSMFISVNELALFKPKKNLKLSSSEELQQGSLYIQTIAGAGSEDEIKALNRICVPVYLDNISYLSPVYSEGGVIILPGTKQVQMETRAVDAIAVTEESAVLGEYNTVSWYAVSSDVTISERITALGEVNLILCDGCTLNAEQGITVEEISEKQDEDLKLDVPAEKRKTGNSLIIYGQEQGTGTLMNNPKKDGSLNSIIGGSCYGYITINGGTVSAVTRKYKTFGIGGSDGRGITINGGNVTATGGENGAGIGHTGVIINGGKVTATGGKEAAGIGSGDGKQGLDISINGGIFNITGGKQKGKAYYNAVGTPSDNSGNAISIKNCTVLAKKRDSSSDVILDSDNITGKELDGCCSISNPFGTVFLQDDGVMLQGNTENSGGCIGTVEFVNLRQEVSEGCNPVISFNVLDSQTGKEAEGVKAEPFFKDGVCQVLLSTNVESHSGLFFISTVSGQGDEMETSYNEFPYSLWSQPKTVVYCAPAMKDGKVKYDNTTGDVKLTEKKAASVYKLEENYSSMGKSGAEMWYSVEGIIKTDERMVIHGDVNLILCDDCCLTAPEGITVNEGASLTIYAQSKGNGALKVSGVSGHNAAIGGEDGVSNGKIMINGGIITAEKKYIDNSASSSGAGIGAGASGNGKNIVVNGGTVTATGGDYASGIGGGGASDEVESFCLGAGKNITINGGVVNATGGTGAPCIGGEGSKNISIRFKTVFFGENQKTSMAFDSDSGNVTEKDIGKYRFVSTGKGIVFSRDESITLLGKKENTYRMVGKVDFRNFRKKIVSGKKTNISFVVYESAECKKKVKGITAKPYFKDGVCYLSVFTTKKAPCDVVYVQTYVGSGDEREKAMNLIPLQFGLKKVDYMKPKLKWNKIVFDSSTGNVKMIKASSTVQPLKKDVKDLGEDGIESWYAVDSNLKTDEYLFICGDVHLILCDGCTLTAENSIYITERSSLTIYGQKKGTGKLVVKSQSEAAGIRVDGELTINGGILNVKGGKYGAGIGGSDREDGHDITINGGDITAIGGSRAAGIGGGLRGAGHDITINGGKVTAKGGSRGAGIGGGSYVSLSYSGITFGNPVGYRIQINGGTVTAKGGSYAAGIGGGFCTRGSDIWITGGNVFAYGGAGSAGIGGGCGSMAENVFIFGGKVTAWGGYYERSGYRPGYAAGIGGGYTYSTQAPCVGRNVIMRNCLLSAGEDEAHAGKIGTDEFTEYDTWSFAYIRLEEVSKKKK